MSEWRSADGKRAVVCVSGEDFRFEDMLAGRKAMETSGPSEDWPLLLLDIEYGQRNLRKLAAKRDEAAKVYRVAAESYYVAARVGCIGVVRAPVTTWTSGQQARC